MKLRKQNRLVNHVAIMCLYYVYTYMFRGFAFVIEFRQTYEISFYVICLSINILM